MQCYSAGVTLSTTRTTKWKLQHFWYNELLWKRERVCKCLMEGRALVIITGVNNLMLNKSILIVMPDIGHRRKSGGAALHHFQRKTSQLVNCSRSWKQNLTFTRMLLGLRLPRCVDWMLFWITMNWMDLSRAAPEDSLIINRQFLVQTSHRGLS